MATVFDLRQHSLFNPYFMAAREILSGTPVPNLEQIREDCCKKYSGTVTGKKLIGGPDATVFSYAIDAENRILQGASPEEIYTLEFEETPSQVREKFRLVLTDLLL